MKKKYTLFFIALSIVVLLSAFLFVRQVSLYKMSRQGLILNQLLPEKGSVYQVNFQPGCSEIHSGDKCLVLVERSEKQGGEQISSVASERLPEQTHKNMPIMTEIEEKETFAQEKVIGEEKPQELSDLLLGRSITIKNGITPQMLKYKHWTGTYTPTFFEILIDGKVVPEGDEVSVSIEDNILVVAYRYSFMNGYKTGARKVVFKVNEMSSTVNLAFSWKTKWHVLTEQAEPQLVEDITFKEQP